jgi:hypothetical protein
VPTVVGTTMLICSELAMKHRISWAPFAVTGKIGKCDASRYRGGTGVA